mgnify:CR=1 FL=1
MDLIDRIELFIRYSLLATTMMFVNTDGAYFRKQIKRIDDILYNDGFESVQSDESESCSVAEGVIHSFGSDETGESSGSGESDEETGSEVTSGSESAWSESESIRISDDPFRFSNVVHERGS